MSFFVEIKVLLLILVLLFLVLFILVIKYLDDGLLVAVVTKMAENIARNVWNVVGGGTPEQERMGVGSGDRVGTNGK